MKIEVRQVERYAGVTIYEDNVTLELGPLNACERADLAAHLREAAQDLWPL